MSRKDIIEELRNMRELNCSITEMWEFIEDNSDDDPVTFCCYLV